MRSGMVKMCFNIARHFNSKGIKTDIYAIKDIEESIEKYQGVKYFRGLEPDYSQYDVVIAHPPFIYSHFAKAKKMVGLIDSVKDKDTLDNPVNYKPDLMIFTTNLINKAFDHYMGNKVIVHPPVFPEEHKIKRGSKITIIGMSQYKGGILAQNLARLLPAMEFMGVISGFDMKHQINQPLKNFEIIHEVEDMKKIWSKTRLLIAPSMGEQYGKASLEAMASGIPVIAYDCPGVQEALGDAAVLMDNFSLAKWKTEILKFNNPDYYAEWSKKCLKQSKKVDSVKELDNLVNKIKEIYGL